MFRTNNVHHIRLIGSTILLLMLMEAPSLAAEVSSLGLIETNLVASAKSMQSKMLNTAKSLFYLLATIEITWVLITLAVKVASLEEIVSELIKRIMFIGLFLFILQNGLEFAQAIVDSLWAIGSDSAEGKMSPTSIFSEALIVNGVISKEADKVSYWYVATILMMNIAGLLVILSCAFLAAILLGAIVEMYIGLIAGMIMLGLGGSSFTKDFAIRYLTYAFSIGMKLLALALIAKIGTSVLLDLSNNSAFAGSMKGATLIAAISIIMAVLGLYVPSIIQGVTQGASAGSGMEVAAASKSVSTTAMAGRTLAGVGAVGISSFQAGAAERKAGGSIGSAIKAGLSTGAGGVTRALGDQAIGTTNAHFSSTLGLANQKIRNSTDAKKGGAGKP